MYHYNLHTHKHVKEIHNSELIFLSYDYTIHLN